MAVTPTQFPPQKSRTSVVYSSRYLDHKTPGHVEAPERLNIALNALLRLDLLPSKSCVLTEPRPCDPRELELIHDPDYVKEVYTFSLLGGGSLDGDTLLSGESYEVALLAVGGALTACEAILAGEFKNAFALVRPPGHHAGPLGRALGASTNGFCLFNNIAITAAYLLRKEPGWRVAIVDFDAHHGNGTQEAFNTNPRLLYVSLHEDEIYPGTGSVNEIGGGEGEGFKVNLPLPHRSGDEVYLEAFEGVALPILEEFRPDFLLISAGFDAHHTDTMSTMKLTAHGYRGMMERLVPLSQKYSGGRMVACLEGGYTEGALGLALPVVVATMAGVSLNLEDRGPAPNERVQSEGRRAVDSARKELGKYWKL